MLADCTYSPSSTLDSGYWGNLRVESSAAESYNPTQFVPIPFSGHLIVGTPTVSERKVDSSLCIIQSLGTLSQIFCHSFACFKLPVQQRSSHNRLTIPRSAPDVETEVRQPESILEMAAQYDPRVPQTFNLSHQYILTNATPPIQDANVLTNSMTRSTYRLHWVWIALWEDFGDCVYQYWDIDVPQADK